MEDPADQPSQSGVLRATLWPPTVRPYLGRVLAHLLRRPSRQQILAAVTDARLPDPLQSAVLRILRRARLWRREQLDVARELAGHFRDGLALGHDPDTLLQEFGNPDAAAKLIRRAKRRARPIWWRTWRMGLRGVAVLTLAVFALYAFLAIRYFASRPTIARNYIAELNASVLTIPEHDRAWPLYRRAFIQLEPLPEILNDCWPPQSSSHAKWPEVRAYLERNRDALELVHAAAARPRLGAPLSDDTFESLSHERAARHASADPSVQSPPAPYQAEPSLFGTPQPFLPIARWFARQLRADLTDAVATGDAARAERDIHSMLRLAAHTREPEFLVAALTAFAIDALAFEAIKTVVAESPDLLSTVQLRQLAHAIAADSDPIEQLSASLRAERTGFLDFVQRLYSDNGSGDGHITATGMARLNALIYPTGSGPESETDFAIMPLAAGTALSRRDLIALYDDMLRRGLDELNTPIWERTVESSSLAYLDSTTRGLYNKARNWPAQMLVPAFSHVCRTARHQQAYRDSTLIAIALELSRREASAFPASLSQLSPRFLPTIPTDPFDGHPLRYRVVDGRPLVYSVGADGIDDGGKPNKTNSMAAAALPPVPPHPGHSPAYQSWIQAVGGDWVLYPKPADPPAPTPPM